MRHLLLYCISFFSSVTVFAQQWPFEYWHDGKAVLESGDTLRGKIKYEIDKDLIQVDVNGTLQSLTSRKVIYYEIFEAVTGRYRQFYSIPFSLTGGYKTPTFFELLSEGKLTLIAREALENRSYNAGYYAYGTINRLVLVDKYFVLDEKGDVNPFSGKKADLLELMRNREEEIKRFIRTSNVNMDRKSDVVRTFAYYNALFKK
jgi:hypothetical protein